MTGRRQQLMVAKTAIFIYCDGYPLNFTLSLADDRGYRD
jgi:hypothetical protein